MGKDDPQENNSRSADTKKKLRFVAYLCLGGSWILANAIFQRIPTIDESIKTEGVLIKIVEPSFRNPGRKLYVENENGRTIFITHYFKRTKVLNQHLDDPITIWSYKRIRFPFEPKNKVLEISINDKNLINNWEALKSKLESDKKFNTIALVFLLSIMIIVMMKISKIRPNNCPQQRDKGD